MRRRRGFTLIELLVVVLVIGVLIALFLPAIRTAHEPRRRAECMFNLKMLGLGLANYELTHHVLPPTASLVGADFAAKVRLLDYLEQQPLFNALNWGQAHDAPANATIRAIRLAAFVCPSDPAATAEAKPPTNRPNAGVHSYPNSLGTYLGNNGGRIDGPFHLEAGPSGAAPIRLTDVTDGAATTAIFSEWRVGRNRGGAEPGAIRWSLDSGDGPVPPATLIAHCRAADSFVSDLRAHDWLDQRTGKGGGYSHVMPPNAPSCLFATGFRPDRTLIGAGSYHPGGVLVAFLDGSVHFIKDTVAPPVWWAFGTIAGGETIPPGSY